MSWTTLLLIALLLACPLMMVFMHRGGHGGHAHGDGHGHTERTAAEPSLDELHRRRDELDAEIETLEREQADEQRPRPPTPVSS